MDAPVGMDVDDSSPSVSTTHSISDKVLQDVNETLGLFASRLKNASDTTIQNKLGIIWFIVCEALKTDPKLRPRLATREEFYINLKKTGEKQFIHSLRDMATTESWSSLFESDVFFKEVIVISKTLQEASIKGWAVPFQGKASDVLLATISDLLHKNTFVYSRQTSIINSPGTGKSRMVDELALKIITVPMCLRKYGTQGFPPPDIELRDWLSSIRNESNPEIVENKLKGIICSILTVLLNRLNSIDPDAENIKNGAFQWTKEARLVRRRQESLAEKFHNLMTSGQTFSSPCEYRKEFYREVIRYADELLDEKPATLSNTSNTNSPPRSNFNEFEGGLAGVAEELCRSIDPEGVLNSNLGPLVILVFDESHILTDNPEGCPWTMFSELRRVLRVFRELPIFSLFLSIEGNFNRTSPEIRSDPSSRVVKHTMRSLVLITEISFDDFAYPAKENTVSLQRVVGLEWMASLGRPLFAVYYETLGKSNEAEFLDFIAQKLLDGRSSLDEDDRPGTLACLSVRFGLEFYVDPISSKVAFQQVERHMRLCLSATTGLERLVTIAGSEPLLAEVASHLMEKAKPAYHLANHSDLDCINIGRRGELIAALIVMEARDAVTKETRCMSVCDFMEALLPQSSYEELRTSLSTRYGRGEGRSFEETFKDYGMWFNHLIKVEDHASIHSDFLWRFITRGAMILCHDGQVGVDIVLPVCERDADLSSDTVTAILIRVKNAKKFKCRIDRKVFDEMDLISKDMFGGRAVRPVIRMIFALASEEAGILFRKRRIHKGRHRSRFTSWDIWCAGLSSFKNIGDDLAPYRVLLERSLRPHGAFELEEFDGDAKNLKGLQRRRMTALASSHDGHHTNYVK